MRLIQAPLKPFELTESRKPARSHLLPSDLTGVLTHGHRGGKGSSPLLHPAGPGVQHEQLIEQAGKWVSQTFFGTLLKQMRNSPFKSPLFEGGRGGEAFGEMYDQRLADHLSRGAGHKLVNAIVKSIESKNSDKAAKARAAYARQSTGGTAAGAQGRHGGTNSGAEHSSRRFPHQPAITAPAGKNRVQPVRAYVASGL